MTRNADLHTHSYYSDGRISPRELVKLAKKRGLEYLALTDHNSIKGVPEAIKEGKRIGIEVIPAVEIETEYSEVLGYFIDLKNKKLNKVLDRTRNEIHERTRDWCKKLKKAGYDISFEEILKKFPESKENINGAYPLYVLYLKNKGKKSMWEIGKEINRKTKKAKKMKMKKLKIVQAIKLIKQAGGVPVLAHPWLKDECLKEKNFKSYVKVGLKGIEIDNGDIVPLRKEKHIKKIRKYAKRYKLLLTCGTDYHGPELYKLFRGNHNLGKVRCDENTVENLRRLAR